MVREQNIVILKAALSVQLISCKRSIALLMVKKFLCVVVLTIPALSDLVIMECTFHFQTWNQLDAYPFPTKPSLFAGGRKKGLSVWSSLYPSLRDVWTMPPLPFPSPCLSDTHARCTKRGKMAIEQELLIGKTGKWWQKRQGQMHFSVTRSNCFFFFLLYRFNLS